MAAPGIEKSRRSAIFAPMPDNIASAITPNGDVYLLEGGGRIVRAGNALTGDRRAEVVYLAKERLDAMYASEDGALHAVGARYHTNAGGTWRKEKIGRQNQRGTSTAVWADARGNVVTGDCSEVVHRTPDGTWTSAPFGAPTRRPPATVHAIGGRRHDDLYAVGGAVAHFDGESWAPLTMPAPALYLDACPRSDHTLIVGRAEGQLFVARGREVELVYKDPKLSFFGVAATDELVYLATGGPLYAWDGRELRQVTDRAGYKVKALGEIVVTGGYREPAPGARAEGGSLVLLNGTWEFWPSPPKDATPVEAVKPAKRTSARQAATGPKG